MSPRDFNPPGARHALLVLGGALMFVVIAATQRRVGLANARRDLTLIELEVN